MLYFLLCCVRNNLLNIPFSELVERVFLKFVLADTDEKLENSFEKFLTPVLLKLGSKSEAVRNKVNYL